MTLSLADLATSPEALILAGVVAKLRADTLLSDVFHPIRIIETPTRQAFQNYGVYSFAIQPFNVRPVDRPSRRSTSFLGIMLSAFLPIEETAEDSRLLSLNIGNHLRKILWGLAVKDPSSSAIFSFATTEFKQLTPLIGSDGGTRILSYQAIFETDVDPVDGDFSS
jgi:hypothetical protein